MKKKAYPHEEQGLFVDSPRNIQKWMQSMQHIYGLSRIGVEWNDAFIKVTSGWDEMEKQDFKKWMQFYQENAHQKYKSAQFPSHIENGGSFIPNIDQLRGGLAVREPNMNHFVVQQDVNEARERALQKEVVEKKIQSLIGRLNSAEKIATNPQVQVALKKCLQMSVEEWVAMLQKLKREIQLAPMRNTTASLLDDIIYKNANQLVASGYKPAAQTLLKLAQMGVPTTPSPMTPGGIGPMGPGDVPMGGQPVGMSDGPEAPEGAGLPGNINSAVAEFLKNLNHEDIGDSNDELELDDELNVEDDYADISVTAQAAPAVVRPPTGGTTDPDLEVSEEEIKAIPQAAPAPVPEQTGDRIDQALSSVGVEDIVSRLEGIASMFKNREIARQLSIIDLMMDKVGIAPFFPTLAEAMRSALESNQYCQSRIEEILAKLRGTMSTPMSERMEGEVSGTGNEAIKAQLAKQEEAENARKERRKMLQEQEEAQALAPQTGPAPGELAGPAQIQSAPPVRPVG